MGNVLHMNGCVWKCTEGAQTVYRKRIESVRNCIDTVQELYVKSAKMYVVNSQ